jgi:hypothetical protein
VSPDSPPSPSAEDRNELAELGPSHIIVAGNSRSGTTMTAKMLGRHSRLHALPELHFVEELWSPSGDHVLPIDDAIALADRLLHNAVRGYHTPYRSEGDRSHAKEVVARAESLRPHDVLARVLTAEAERHGKSVGIEQTPRNVYFLGDLLARLPRARAVVVVRDPRDVLLSQRNWWRRRWRGSRVSLQTTLRRWVSYHPVTTTLLWRSGIRRGDQWASVPGVTVIRFEDLVADPVSELTSLMQAWGLDFEEDMLRVPRMSSSNRTDRGNDGIVQGVDASVAGRGARDLSATELWLCQRLTRRERALHGYAEVQVDPQPLGLLVHMLSLPLKIGLGLALNRGRTQSLVQTVRRRLVRSTQ